MASAASYQVYITHGETKNHAHTPKMMHVETSPDQTGKPLHHPAFTNSQAWSHTDCFTTTYFSWIWEKISVMVQDLHTSVLWKKTRNNYFNAVPAEIISPTYFHCWGEEEAWGHPSGANSTRDHCGVQKKMQCSILAISTNCYEQVFCPLQSLCRQARGRTRIVSLHPTWRKLKV